MKNKIHIVSKGIFFLMLVAFFLSAKNVQVVLAGGWDIGSIYAYNLPSAPIYLIITNIMSWLLGLIGTVGIIGFVIAGFLYLTASGSETQVEKAKKATKYSIIGVIVALVGLVILNAAYNMLFVYSIFIW